MVSLLVPMLLAPAQLKVACVGDSITFGYALPESTRAKMCYPGVLSQRLGGGFQVKNFGHTGCTLMNLNWLPPLMKTEEYKQSLAFNPNIVFLMGGTNDGHPRNWSHASQLGNDLKEIVASYRKLPTHPTIYLLVPPRLCTKAEKGVLDDDQCHNVNQLLPPVLRSFAKANAVTLIDTRTVVNTRDCYGIDGIHLNEKGCAKVANLVANVLLKKKTKAK